MKVHTVIFLRICNLELAQNTLSPPWMVGSQLRLAAFCGLLFGHICNPIPRNRLALKPSHSGTNTKPAIQLDGHARITPCHLSRVSPPRHICTRRNRLCRLILCYPAQRANSKSLPQSLYGGHSRSYEFFQCTTVFSNSSMGTEALSL